MDYKELIEELRFLSGFVPEQMCDDDGKDAFEKAAAAIETLLAERDADIILARCIENQFGDCHCSNCKGNILHGSRYCNWCGAKLGGTERCED